jgi:glycosyltransferase involved in cell wall biosynthesis
VVDRRGQMDGVPVALMEALACGVPTVSTRLSGIPELVRDGETGLLAEPGDPASLADAIERTLADPAAAEARAAAGRKLVEAEFDIRASGRRMAELFRGAA